MPGTLGGGVRGGVCLRALSKEVSECLIPRETERFALLDGRIGGRTGGREGEEGGRNPIRNLKQLSQKMCGSDLQVYYCWKRKHFCILLLLLFHTLGVLYYTILCCTKLYYISLYYTVL